VLVLGPALTKNSVSGSIETLKQFGNGTMRTGAPSISFGIVDVRDVARAHILAGYTAHAQGRYLVNAESLDFLGISKILREKYSLRYPLPITPVPKFLFWLAAPILGYQRKFVKNNVGYPMKVDASKSIRELGIQYRSVRETLHEHFQQLIDDGLIKNRG
jgi:nucleoside-diphosphate-sugar epimerase